MQIMQIYSLKEKICALFDILRVCWLLNSDQTKV